MWILITLITLSMNQEQDTLTLKAVRRQIIATAEECNQMAAMINQTTWKTDLLAFCARVKGDNT